MWCWRGRPSGPDSRTHILPEKIGSWVDMPIAIHCDNDFGLAVTCSLSASKAEVESLYCIW